MASISISFTNPLATRQGGFAEITGETTGRKRFVPGERLHAGPERGTVTIFSKKKAVHRPGGRQTAEKGNLSPLFQNRHFSNQDGSGRFQTVKINPGRQALGLERHFVATGW